MVKDPSIYEIGYRRPPTATQFKRGQSGNPRGRRRTTANIETLLAKELNRQLTYNENGVSGKESKLSLMIKQAINKAVSGDFRALGQLIRMRQVIQGIKNSV